MIPRMHLALLAGLFAAACGVQAQPSGDAPATPAAQPAGQGAGDPEKEAAGRMAALGWLTLLDRKDWGTAWEQSASTFRQMVPLGTWMDSIPKVRGPFGRLVERENAETIYKTTLQGRPDGHYVHTSFLSKFERQVVQEIVTTTLDQDGKWRVLGYSYQQVQ